MLLFRDEEHVNRWCRGRNIPPGGTMSLAQGWQLAHVWFKDRLNPDWRRYTLEETRSIFRELHLDGDFWEI